MGDKKRRAQDNVKARGQAKKSSKDEFFKVDNIKGNSNIDKLYYKKSDTGQFNTLLSLKVDYSAEDRPRSPMNIQVGRDLFRMGICCLEIERAGRYKWILSFPSRDAANDACRNKYLESSKYNMEIPWYFVFRRIVLLGIPLDISAEEINSEFIRCNNRIGIDGPRTMRLQRRNKFSNEPKFVDSTAIRMVVRTNRIPEYIFLWNQKVSVTAFTPGIRCCSNCGQLNHSTKFCKNEAKCLLCGEDEHLTSKCSGKASCLNCKGEHKTLSQECSEIIIKKQINNLMAVDNISYNKARMLVKKEQSAFHNQIKNDRRFPQLNRLQTPISKEACSLVTSSLSFAEVTIVKTKDKVNEEDKTILAQIEKIIIECPDRSILLKRIWKACNLHGSVGNQ